MCGRFTQLYSWPELVALYRLTMPPVNLQPSYNVYPTDPVDVALAKEGGGLDFVRMRWGFGMVWSGSQRGQNSWPRTRRAVLGPTL